MRSKDPLAMEVRVLRQAQRRLRWRMETAVKVLQEGLARVEEVPDEPGGETPPTV